MVAYLALSKRDNEQSDLMAKVSADKKLEQLPELKYVLSLYNESVRCVDGVLLCLRQLLKLFMTPELMRWPTFEEQYRRVFGSDAYFSGVLSQLVYIYLRMMILTVAAQARLEPRRGRTCTAV